ncbi:MAG: YceI family protein [Actinomycetota bacterium]|nr:YceI family protein [Actinomycetota bacterium]
MDQNERRKLLIGVGAVALIGVVAAIAGVWWFLKDDAPDEVDLADAVSVAEQESSAADAAADADEGVDDEGDPGDPAATVEGVDGIWSVDTSIGTFTFEEATGTFVGFRVEEELSRIGTTTAVGRTGTVNGELEIAGTELVSTSLTADLSRLTTNDSRRDNKAKGALNTGEFPMATFVLDAPVDLGGAVEDGSPVTVEATGQLTIKGVTQTVVVTIDAQLVGDIVAVVGSTEVVFADFGVEVPTAPIVVSAEDHGIIEFQLLFTKN